MASKPTQRTIEELKKQGYRCHIVERWNSFAKIRQDFGGFADILAYKEGQPGVLAIQTTSDDNVSSRVKKITEHEADDKKSVERYYNVRCWLGSNNRIEVWGWGLKGAYGERKKWTLRIVPIAYPPKISV